MPALWQTEGGLFTRIPSVLKFPPPSRCSRPLHVTVCFHPLVIPLTRCVLFYLHGHSCRHLPAGNLSEPLLNWDDNVYPKGLSWVWISGHTGDKALSRQELGWRFVWGRPNASFPFSSATMGSVNLIKWLNSFLLIWKMHTGTPPPHLVAVRFQRRLVWLKKKKKSLSQLILSKWEIRMGMHKLCHHPGPRATELWVLQAWSWVFLPALTVLCCSPHRKNGWEGQNGVVERGSGQEPERPRFYSGSFPGWLCKLCRCVSSFVAELTFGRHVTQQRCPEPAHRSSQRLTLAVGLWSTLQVSFLGAPLLDLWTNI